MIPDDGLNYKYPRKNSTLFAKLVAVSDVKELMMTAYTRYRRFVKSVDHKLTLDPNHGQLLKLGRYSLGLSQRLKIGKNADLFITESPTVTIRAKRVIINVPCPGFVYLNTLLTANVATMAGGAEDAWAYSAASNVELDYPTLPPSQKITIAGEYTGLIVPPYRVGKDFLLTVSVFGPSTIAGGC